MTGRANDNQPAPMTCGSCDFWKRAPFNPAAIGTPQMNGQCKRYPPTPMIYVGADARGNITPMLQTAFPMTPESEGCFEHSAFGMEEGDEEAVN